MTKRLVDVVVGGLLAVLVSPLIIVLAIGAAITLGAWPFFVQRRVGKDEEEFRIVKIRTLPPSAPAYADKYEIAAVHTPRYCAVLRQLHLDELPQLWLVPFGPMSLIGPRPEMRLLHDRYARSFARLRTSVRPGCTGLWQISDRLPNLIGEAPEYDRMYVEHVGARLDLWVLWRTACTLLRLGEGRTLADIPPWALQSRPRSLAPVIDLRTIGDEASVDRRPAVHVQGELAVNA